MRLITGFEEEFATTDKPPTLPFKDFEQIPAVIKHDPNVAENIFARGAKKELRQALSELCKEEVPNVRAADCLGTYPVWIAEMTVALSISEPNFSHYLSSAIRSLADNMMDSMKDSTPAFVDSLQVKIIPVYTDKFNPVDGIYQFRLKQKWVMTRSLIKEKTNDDS